jgi:microcompartment protein CcmL/EutN
MSTSPAIALLEFSSVAAGIVAGDAMAKRAPIATLDVGTVQPGHYLVLVSGEVADVEEAVTAGAAAAADVMIDIVVLPDVHPAVVEAVRGERITGPVEALGVIETDSVAATIDAADGGIKGAAVDILELHIADGLGGKAYVLFGGTVADVEAAVDVGSGRVHDDHLVRVEVISQLHPEMRENLESHPRFGRRVGREDGGAAR